MLPTSSFDFTNEEYDLMIKGSHLTAKELQIINMKRDGMADIDIAIELNLCRTTVIKYKLKAYDKMIKSVIKSRKK